MLAITSSSLEGGVAVASDGLIAVQRARKDPGRAVVLAAAEDVGHVERRPAVELDGAQVGVEICPARADRSGAQRLSRLRDTAVVPRVEGVRAREQQRVEVGMNDAAEIGLPDVAVMGAAVTRCDY